MYVCVCVCVLSSQWCRTLCSSVDCSGTDSSVHGIFQEEDWSGLPVPTPGDLPEPGSELMFLVSPAAAGGLIIPTI